MTTYKSCVDELVDSMNKFLRKEARGLGFQQFCNKLDEANNCKELQKVRDFDYPQVYEKQDEALKLLVRKEESLDCR